MENSSSISPEETDLIEKYLMQEMSAEEQAAFEHRLAGDQVLQFKVNEMKLLIIGINESMLTQKLEIFHEEVKTATPVRSIQSVKKYAYRKWLAAASVVILAGITVFYFATKPSLQEQLYQTYYSADPGLMTTMSSASDNYTFEKAMVDYKSGDVWNAIESWEQLQTANPLNDTLNYFLGSAWLKLDHQEKAIPYLQQVANKQASVFNADAHWYLGLALLQQGNRSEAVAEIKKSDHPQKGALLKDISNMNNK
ncbi:tetratricopeptide repeat protein [Pollutibacter soli]|uniref:tetratricopeptide repeat protein n=1 Tax=Pollutibacter soli TaxID=3034157 RepID=UPI003013D8AD